MFTQRTSHQAEKTSRVKDFVLTTKWDLVVCDEVHHAAAITYRPLIEQLRTTAHRVLGFTGTLCRHELPPKQEAAVRTGHTTRDDAMAELFRFVGRRLYSCTPRELEDDGLIAKLWLMEVHTPMTQEFAIAHELATGTIKKYVESLHPNKMRVVWALVAMHRAVGDIGMIFVGHLLHGKILKAMLGSRWEILAGGNAHGTDGVHTAEANAAIVQRFNNRELDGIISTPVGESSLDVNHDDFRYAIVVDAHSGPAAASQKLGRLARTTRLATSSIDVLVDAQQRAQRLAVQKHAAYYEARHNPLNAPKRPSRISNFKRSQTPIKGLNPLNTPQCGFGSQVITPNTEEAHAAGARHEQFRSEGYSHRVVEHNHLLAIAAKANPKPCIYESAHEQLRLLIDVLSYRTLGCLESQARAESSALTAPHRKAIKELKAKAGASRASVMKERYAQAAKNLKKQTSSVKAIAKDRHISKVSGRIMSPTARKVMQTLNVAPALLRELGVEL